MAIPFVIPDNWHDKDWSDICILCKQARFLIEVAEQRLPGGAIEVLRCENCGRALWYRSNASTTTLVNALAAIYAKVHIIRVGEWHRQEAPTTSRQPDHGQQGTGFHEKKKGRKP